MFYTGDLHFSLCQVAVQPYFAQLVSQSLDWIKDVYLGLDQTDWHNLQTTLRTFFICSDFRICDGLFNVHFKIDLLSDAKNWFHLMSLYPGLLSALLIDQLELGEGIDLVLDQRVLFLLRAPCSQGECRLNFEESWCSLEQNKTVIHFSIECTSYLFYKTGKYITLVAYNLYITCGNRKQNKHIPILKKLSLFKEM